MNKYELIKILGDGTYGIVYEGRDRETREKVAVKKLKEKFSSLEECLKRKEVRILEQLNHENIVQLKEVIREKSGETSYIFEYCDCNLFDFIDKYRKNQRLIPEPIIRDIVFQITKGIKFMHSNQYFHRDLKPENILVKLNDYDFNNINDNNNQLKIKIADFGTAKEIPLRNNMPMTDYVCTRWYRAPECVLRTDFYDEKIDVWAIGCIMAELYILGPIFPGENEFDQLHQILRILGTPTRGKWPWGYYQTELLGLQLPSYYKKDFRKILKYISKEGANLLNEIFQFEPSMRPSCSKILNHPYFKMIEKIPISPYQSNIRNISRRNMILKNLGEIDKSKNSIPYKNKSNKSIINEIKITKINNINNAITSQRNKISQVPNKFNKNNFNKRIEKENDSKIKNNININSNRKKNNRSLYISNKNINNLKLNNDTIEINKNINMRNTINSNININGHNTIRSNINNIGNNYINYSGYHKSNINNFRKTITDKNLKKSRYEKVNETKVGIDNKKILLRFSKNIREDNKDNDSDYNRTELNSNRIGSFKSNSKRKYSYISIDKEENKDDSKNKTIENYKNKRYIHFSSDKNKIPKRIIEYRRKKKEFTKYNNLENDYSDLSCDGNNYNTNNNYYDKYNSYRKSNDKKIIHFDKKANKIYENSKDNNNSNYNIIFRSNHKNANKDNHTFYESKAGKMSYKNNNNSHSNYNSCKCSLLRNYSTKRNVMNKDEGIYISNTHNIRNLGDYYMNNNSPRAYSNKRKNNINSLSPVRKNEQNNSLFNSFLLPNNNNFSSGKSQSLVKDRKIKSNNYSKNTKDNNRRNQIKVVNMKENKNNNNNYNNNFIIYSSSKNRSSIKTVN